MWALIPFINVINIYKWIHHVLLRIPDWLYYLPDVVYNFSFVFFRPSCEMWFLRAGKEQKCMEISRISAWRISNRFSTLLIRMKAESCHWGWEKYPEPIYSTEESTMKVVWFVNYCWLRASAEGFSLQPIFVLLKKKKLKYIYIYQ